MILVIEGNTLQKKQISSLQTESHFPNVGANEQKALEEIRNNNRVTAKEIAAMIGISLRQTERLLASLKAKGLIRRTGPDKTGRWEIIG